MILPCQLKFTVELSLKTRYITLLVKIKNPALNGQVTEVHYDGACSEILYSGKSMALDPQAKAFIDNFYRQKSTPFYELGAVKAREAYAQRPDNLAAQWVPLFQVRDHTITTTNANIPVRIYTPKASDTPLPIVVYYHGGGMVIGTLDSYDTLCRQLAVQSHCIVISVDYRLAPENKFPAAVEDAWNTALWVSEQAQALGGDAHKIAIGGDSAGGNLAAVVCLLARDSELIDLQFQLLIYPVTAPYSDSESHLKFAEGYFFERKTALWFDNCYLDSEKSRQDFRYAPLVAESLANLPPALVVVAGFDILRDEGIAYAEGLKASGVNVELQEYQGMFHPFVSLSGVLDEGKRAIRECAYALRQHFK